MHGFTGKQRLMLQSLKVFYSEPKNIERLLPIVNGESTLSLRLLDWYVTNYSKKHNTFYTLNSGEGKPCHFFVFLNYKSQLKAYSKKQFDPFCRRNRIRFFYNDKDYLITTIGQLNFFRWAINYNVLDYVEEHRKIIEIDMNQAIKQAYGNKRSSTSEDSSDSSTSSTGRKKRQELSESATKKVNKTKVKVTISFD